MYDSTYSRAYELSIATIEQRNKVYSGDTVEVLFTKGETKKIKLKDMKNDDGDVIVSAPSAQMIFTIKCNEKLKNGDMLIKAKNEEI